MYKNLFQRKANSKTTSRAGLTLDRDCTTVNFDELLRDRKTNSTTWIYNAFWQRMLKEPLKYTILFIPRNPDTSISDLNIDPVNGCCFIQPHRYGNCTMFGRKLKSVRKKVKQDLFKFVLVKNSFKGFEWRIKIQFDIFLFRK